jgi:hypothetical protein
MNPRRLHSDTIFSMSGISFGSAIGSWSVRHATILVKKVKPQVMAGCADLAGARDCPQSLEAARCGSVASWDNPSCSSKFEIQIRTLPNPSSCTVYSRWGKRLGEPCPCGPVRQQPAPPKLRRDQRPDELTMWVAGTIRQKGPGKCVHNRIALGEGPGHIRRGTKHSELIRCHGPNTE